MRDMIPPGDRSIRNIPIPAGHRHIEPQEVPQYYQQEPVEPPRRAPRARPRRRPGRFILWALAVVLVCAGGVAGVSMVYAGAAVSVHPRVQTVAAASTTIQAQINAPVGTLAFARMSATQSATTTVPATGTKKVSRQASGTVLITSTYSADQRLVAGTRLNAGDGKIYKLASSVDLPANGNVVGTINAESPGESYNRSSAATFTFPGFAGDPRFEKFSAKTQGAIAGGFVGDEPAVADSDLLAAQATLKAALDTQTQRQISQSIPSTSTAVPGTLAIAYGEMVQTPSADKKTVTISQSATASGAVVGIRDLASALARKLVADYKGEAIDFMEQGSLTMTASTTKESDQMTLVLSGETILVWQFDPAKLKTAMAGKDKGQFQAIVESFAPAITTATATVRPFWIKNFPSDTEKIDISIDTSK